MQPFTALELEEKYIFRQLNDACARISNDINGNPRYVLHYLAFASDFETAAVIANSVGWSQYTAKPFNRPHRRAFVGQSYSIAADARAIAEAKVKHETHVPFGLVWRHTDYCYSEISNFQECVGNIDPQDLQDRYLKFLETFRSVKKNTLVEKDVLQMFIADLDNRAQIDYREGHWDEEPEIVAGGKRFDKRCRQLREIHREWLGGAA